MKFFVILFFLVGNIVSGNTQSISDYYYTDKTALSISAAQTNTTADIADFIKANFDTDSKKVRAIYTWVAANIIYTSDSIHPLIFEEDREQRIATALKRRKGVCENYAAIFNDICLRSGLRSLIIEGYTKQNGSMDKSPHAWCTVFIDGKWHLYDPTWDEERAHRGLFTGNIIYEYFQVSPELFIQSHMPFDPMFQLLNYPVTYKEFYNGNTQINHSIPYFNYADSISVFENINYLDKYLSAAQRIEKNGVPSPMISNKLKQLKMDIEIIYEDRDTALYNSAIADYNTALSIFNTYINYRNNQFIPTKTDVEVQSLFQDVEKRIASGKFKLDEVNHSKAGLTLNTASLEKVFDDLSAHVKEQQIFLRDYLVNPQKVIFNFGQ
ncbi:MAG: transglutaminase domain-containing protein [Ginsengibacter sp.]